MIGLALGILAVYIIGSAVLGALGFTVWIGGGLSNWLDERPGRRKRFRWTVTTVVSLPVLLGLYATAPEFLAALAGLAGMFGLAVLICLGLDRLWARWQ